MCTSLATLVRMTVLSQQRKQMLSASNKMALLANVGLQWLSQVPYRQYLVKWPFVLSFDFAAHGCKQKLSINSDKMYFCLVRVTGHLLQT
jgi:hypothetical protein